MAEQTSKSAKGAASKPAPAGTVTQIKKTAAPKAASNDVKKKTTTTSTSAKPKAATKKKTVAAKKAKLAAPKVVAKKEAPKKVKTKKSVKKAKPVAKKAPVKSKPAVKAAKKATQNPLAFLSQLSAYQPTKLNPLLSAKAFQFKPMEEIMSKSAPQFDKLAQDAANMSREGFDAFTKSYGIFAKGYENLFRTSIELGQTAAEKQASYAKEALSCKTLNEFAEVQNKIAQANFDDFMSGVTQLSELSAKVLTESSEPLNDQIGKAVKKMSEAA